MIRVRTSRRSSLSSLGHSNSACDRESRLVDAEGSGATGKREPLKRLRVRWNAIRVGVGGPRGVVGTLARWDAFMRRARTVRSEEYDVLTQDVRSRYLLSGQSVSLTRCPAYRLVRGGCTLPLPFFRPPDYISSTAPTDGNDMVIDLVLSTRLGSWC